jgi:diadenosine tetraphosphate (Ap4A) HIT family hydrolase
MTIAKLPMLIKKKIISFQKGEIWAASFTMTTIFIRIGFVAPQRRDCTTYFLYRQNISSRPAGTLPSYFLVSTSKQPKKRQANGNTVASHTSSLPWQRNGPKGHGPDSLTFWVGIWTWPQPVTRQAADGWHRFPLACIGPWHVCSYDCRDNTTSMYTVGYTMHIMDASILTYPNCEICPIVERIDPAFILANGKYWFANLRNRDQTLLGTSYITLKRHAPELDYLTQQEESEFIVMRNELIRAIRSSFRPVTFNVACLKNDAFKADPDNTPPESSHVHWQIKPRYSSEPIEFAGETFRDPLPGKYLSTFERHEPQHDTAAKIAQTIRAHI